MSYLIHGGDIYTKRETVSTTLIDFSANINPLGLPLLVKEAIIENIDSYTSYPDPLCRELRQAISIYENTEMENIICGNGAADLIYKIVLAFKPQKALIIAPTFSEYEEAMRLVNGKIEYYYLSETTDFYINDDILDSITEDLNIMFVCNPNNPTGIPLSAKKMLAILKKCRQNNVILVVDECFIEFLEKEEDFSVSKYINQYDNLIILKAFTKIYAMAGIRLGYTICANSTMNDEINSIGQPWSVSTVASKAGIAALKEREYLKNTKEYIKNNRNYLINELKSLGYKVFDSSANFVFIKSNDIEIKDKLEQFGILIRSCSNFGNLDNRFFRIAVKGTQDNELLINSLKLCQRGE